MLHKKRGYLIQRTPIAEQISGNFFQFLPPVLIAVWKQLLPLAVLGRGPKGKVRDLAVRGGTLKWCESQLFGFLADPDIHHPPKGCELF